LILRNGVKKVFILIVGGGKAGRYLISDFLNKGYRVVLVEQDQNKVDKIKEKFGIKVVCGDGTEKEVLEKAGIKECDAVLAVTEDDQDNLVICQLAERQYNITHTYTNVNTPGNEKLFNWLGVNAVISSAAILSALVDNEVTINDLSRLLNKDQDKLKLIRLSIPPEGRVVNKRIKDIDFPQEAILVAILRNNTSIVPRGNTFIKEKDIILALTKPELKEELINILNK